MIICTVVNPTQIPHPDVVPIIPTVPEVPWMPDPVLPVQRMGWVCPKCGGGVSPDHSTCPVCISVTITCGTSTDLRFPNGDPN